MIEWDSRVKLGVRVEGFGRVAIRPARDIEIESLERRRYDIQRFFSMDPGVREDGIRMREEVIEELIKLLEETIDPDSWQDAGGDFGRIRAVGDSLEILTTTENHAQILNLLDQLEDTRPLEAERLQKVLGLHPWCDP